MAPPEVSSYRQRAQRFPIKMQMEYRGVDAERWKESTTENISSTGVLFWAGAALPAEAPIEMMLMWSPYGGAGSAVRLFCRGRVVRARPAESAEGIWGVAASILEYRFVNARTQEPC